MITLEPARRPADGAARSAEIAGEAEAWSGLGLSRVGLIRFLKRAQAAVGLRGEVDVLLAGDRTMRRLNREFRGKDKTTDVLSFPAAAEFAQHHGGDVGGDVAISLETAQRQAAEQGHSLRDEVRVLLLHGLLHLAGMDHEVDRGEMAAREDELRVRLRLPNGLIARVGSAKAKTNGRSFAALRVTTGDTTTTADCSAALRNDNQKSRGKRKSTSTSMSTSKSESTSKSKSKGKGTHQGRAGVAA
jgi:probable rRNA maturation factor